MNPQSPFMSRMRVFNKHILNRLTRYFAGAAFGPFALIYHVGRRSGKPYETPIMVAPVADGFVIALTYGPEADWYRNVLATGHCRLRWHGKDYEITAVEPMDVEAARRAFPQPFRPILKFLGTQHFSKMKHSLAKVG